MRCEGEADAERASVANCLEALAVKRRPREEERGGDLGLVDGGGAWGADVVGCVLGGGMVVGQDGIVDGWTDEDECTDGSDGGGDVLEGKGGVRMTSRWTWPSNGGAPQPRGR